MISWMTCLSLNNPLTPLKGELKHKKALFLEEGFSFIALLPKTDICNPSADQMFP